MIFWKLSFVSFLYLEYMGQSTEERSDADNEDHHLLAELVLGDSLPPVLNGGDDDLHGGELTVHPEEEDEAEEDD